MSSSSVGLWVFESPDSWTKSLWKHLPENACIAPVTVVTLSFLRLTLSRSELWEHLIWQCSMLTSWDGRPVVLHPSSSLGLPFLCLAAFSVSAPLAEKEYLRHQGGVRESWVLSRKWWWVRRWGQAGLVLCLPKRWALDSWEAIRTGWQGPRITPGTYSTA